MTAPSNPTALFRSPGRLEAFSDGVFAIAITLLILEIKGRPLDGSRAVPGLLEWWPSYFAFLTIFVAGSGHHLMVKTETLPLVWVNGFFPLVITLLPFPTALVAEHLTSPSGPLAVAVYAVTNAFGSLMYRRLYHVSNQGRTGCGTPG